MNKELVEMARESGGIDLTNTRANVTIWIGTGTSDFLDAFAKLIAEKAIKEALAHPEQEPVAFASHGVVNWIADKQFQHEANLYIAPQIKVGCAECGVNGNHALYCVACAEKYLEDKNT